MSDALEDLISKAFSATLVSAAEAVLPDISKNIITTKGMKAALTAKIEHDARRFAENEMGLKPTLIYQSEIEFFDKYLAPRYETDGASQAKGWCAKWSEHQSVRKRIHAMWHRYEVLARTDPGNCDETFLRTVGDHHMDRLTGERSPMAACLIKHKPSEKLESTAVEDTTTAEGELS